MDIHERVKFIRKDLNLTQKEFGYKIAVAQSYLTNIESGIRPVTDKIVKLICNEFNINEEWLRYGTGDMRLETTDDKLKDLAKEYNFNNIEYKFLREYLNLDMNKREAVVEFLESVLTGDSSFVATSEKVIEKENFNTNYINEEVEAYRKELQAEEKGATLSASEKLG